MFSIGGWLAAVMPMVGGHGSKPLPDRCPQPLPNHIPPYRSIADYSHDFIGNNALVTTAITAAQPLPNPCPTAARKADTVAVRLAPSDGTRLRFISDVSRPGPRDFEDAAEQFVDLMRDAVGRGYLLGTVPFAELRRFYNAIASEFEWPTISDVRLSKLLERTGCRKIINRDRKNGGDKRTVAYLFR
jgi:hypothetical protein